MRAENILPKVCNDSQDVGFEQLSKAMLVQIKVVSIGREILKAELKKKKMTGYNVGNKIKRKGKGNQKALCLLGI